MLCPKMFFKKQDNTKIGQLPLSYRVVLSVNKAECPSVMAREPQFIFTRLKGAVEGSNDALSGWIAVPWRRERSALE